MTAPAAFERDGVRITALARPLHEELPDAEIAAWRDGPGGDPPGEQRKEEGAREQDIARQGWTGPLLVPAVRAKLESLFGAPTGRGDDYKMSFEYALRAETPAGIAHLAIGDWKAWGVVIMQDYTTATPEARRLARGALWRAVADAPLADFEDEFRYDEADGVRYGCRGGTPWMDEARLGANVQASWDAEAAEEAGDGGVRRRARVRAVVALVAASGAAALAGGRWGVWAGLAAFVAAWIAAQHGMLVLQRRR